MTNTSRYNPTDDIGVSYLELCVRKDLGWIARTTTNSDIGIDMTIEQVINGNGTAHYISVQLKTGLGNVHTDKDGNYVYYIKQVHYDYWLSSAIPVIFVLCDPNTGILYWQQIKLSKVSATPTGHKLVVSKKHLLNKESLPELNSIIAAYQSQFSLPEFFEEDKGDIEYWTELLDTCKQCIIESTESLNEIHEKYEKTINATQIKLNTTTNYNRLKNQFARSLTLILNVGRMKFMSSIPVISQTFIEALRCAEAVLLESALISPIVSSYIRDVLNGIHSTLLSSIQTFSKGSLKYQQYSGHSNELDRTEAAFGMVIEDYAANLQLLDSYVIKILDRLGKTNSD